MSVVFPLLHADGTAAGFGPGCFSAMDEHLYLPAETERQQQSHPRTALGSWPVPQIWPMAPKASGL